MDLADTLRATPLRIGISTRALFDLEEENKVFEQEGVLAYEKLQLERENVALNKGAAFHVIERLLGLNEKDKKPFVEVILLSRNSPNLSLRAFNSINKYNLDIKLGSFTSGRSIAPYIKAWAIDLFLSFNGEDVQGAVDAGAAAARLITIPKAHDEQYDSEVRIAFDGDAVVFSAESDEIYKNKGLQAFLEHEQANALQPMAGGPFGNFLQKLSILRKIYLGADGVSKVRIAIVTARNAPAHERVVQTLRAWGTPADEAHFVGHKPKHPILDAFAAHIFFDDQEKHILGASGVVPAGHVPGPHLPENPIIPAA